MLLEIPDAHEHDVALVDGRKAGDCSPQQLPPIAGQDGEAHPVEETEASVRGVEVRVGVEPDDTDGSDSGDCAEAAVAVAREHQRKRTALVGSVDAPGQPAISLGDTHDLGIVRVGRVNRLELYVPALLAELVGDCPIAGQT